MAMVFMLRDWHDRFFVQVERLLEGWFPGLLARFVFLAVLFFYYLQSFGTKVGSGISGFFEIQPGAWYQIAPLAMEAAGGTLDAIPFWPWHVLVPAGTYGELLLPVLLVLGLFTRLAATGMIGFVAVQTLTDIYGHMADADAIGAWFDRVPDSAIADQRLLWVFPLIYLVLKGAGALSLDAVITRLMPQVRR